MNSASALPTNLAAAAKGPEADKYTTPAVEPLSAREPRRAAVWALPAC